MAKTYNRLNIEVKEAVIDIITVKQNDANSRYLAVLLTDDGVPVNLTRHTVRFSAVKPDGRRIFNNCVITDAAKGRFQVEMTNQVLAVPGIIYAEFTIYGENETEVLTTQTFSITVVKNLPDLEAVESTNEFGAAAVLFQDVAAVRETINEMAALLNLNLDVKVSSRASQLSVDMMADTVVREVMARLATGEVTMSLPRTRPFCVEASAGADQALPDLLNITGKGYISGISVYGSNNSGTILVTVDGSEAYPLPSMRAAATGTYNTMPLFIRYTKSIRISVEAGTGGSGARTVAVYGSKEF